jgi:hypothetical protein
MHESLKHLKKWDLVNPDEIVEVDKIHHSGNRKKSQPE